MSTKTYITKKKKKIILKLKLQTSNYTNTYNGARKKYTYKKCSTAGILII